MVHEKEFECIDKMVSFIMEEIEKYADANPHYRKPECVRFMNGGIDEFTGDVSFELFPDIPNAIRSKAFARWRNDHDVIAMRKHISSPLGSINDDDLEDKYAFEVRMQMAFLFETTKNMPLIKVPQ